ncbi:MAG TPA: hypothetical protein VKZ86_04980 [Cyclobacteriaceae bacterium]|nr:hypothetical protein [Cyclobacteriaceae bacterium]
MKTLCWLTGLWVAAAVPAIAQTPNPSIRIKSAVLAAPEGLREGATVLGVDANGDVVVLRKGTNEMICLADDPKKDGLNVSCYHRDLEPFMARGRALQKEGKSFQEIFDIREAEVKAGKLSMPESPTTLFVFTAPREGFNTETGEVTNGYLRYVVYIPYATAESTGLPLKPDVPGMPWIMDPGTHRAHIMINPAK